MESNWIFDTSSSIVPLSHENQCFINFDSPNESTNDYELHIEKPLHENSGSKDISTSAAQGQQNQTQTQTQPQNETQHQLSLSSQQSSLSNTPVGHDSSSTHHQLSKPHDENLNWSDIPDLNDIEMNLNMDFLHHHHHHHDDPLMIEEDSQKPIEHANDSSKSSVPPTPQSFHLNSSSSSSFNHHHHHHQDSTTASTSFISYNSPLIDHHHQQQQQQQQQQQHIQQQTSIRPDVVFTPLVSPAVTPLESMMNSNIGNKQSSNFFSPLTSPALEAKSPVRMRKSSNSPNDEQQDTKKKYTKRKTPGNTPIVGPTIPGRVAKQSPIIKARRSSSYASNLMNHQGPVTQEYADMKLPDSSVDAESEIMGPPKATTRSKRKNSVSKQQQQQQQQQQQYQHHRQHQPHQHQHQTSQQSQPATPATLMNFKLESSTSQNSSPIILPSSSNSFEEQDPNSKKTSHKLAEQGRRNRMNQAIMDLASLIPEDLNQTVAIPSKATTVELASLYIKNLQTEVQRLQDELNDSLNDDVSPLESTNNGKS